MATTQESLFGMPPELYAQQQNAGDAAAALQFAQMDPSQRGAFSLFQAGRQAGRGAQQAFGGEDPMLSLAKNRQSVLSTIDPSDPVSFRTAAQKLVQVGDYQGAEHLVKTSRELEKTLAEAEMHRSTTTKNLRESLTPEQRNAAALTDSSGLERGTPEYMKAYNEHLAKLTMAGKEGAKVVGVAEGTKEPVYLTADGSSQFIFQKTPQGLVKVPYAGGVDRSTANIKVSASADKKEEDEYSKRAGYNAAELEKTAMETARSSARAIRSLGTMENKAKAGVYQGPQAQMTLDAANFLESMGLLSKDQRAKLTNSTEYDKNAKDLVMSDLGGKLGAQVSDADRKFVEARIPQITTSPQARMELIQKLRELHTKNIEYYRKMQAHLKANRTLKDFDFADADGLSSTSPVAPEAPKSQRSDEDHLKQYLGK